MKNMNKIKELLIKELLDSGLDFTSNSHNSCEELKINTGNGMLWVIIPPNSMPIIHLVNEYKSVDETIEFIKKIY